MQDIVSADTHTHARAVCYTYFDLSLVSTLVVLRHTSHCMGRCLICCSIVIHWKCTSIYPHPPHLECEINTRLSARRSSSDGWNLLQYESVNFCISSDASDILSDSCKQCSARTHVYFELSAFDRESPTSWWTKHAPKTYPLCERVLQLPRWAQRPCSHPIALSSPRDPKSRRRVGARFELE